MGSSKYFLLSACALLLPLAWCTDVDACRRHRCRTASTPCCAVSNCGHYVPNWVRWIDVSNRATTTTCASHDMKCWCCKSGMWQQCIGPTETCSGIKQCLALNTDPWQLGLICPSTYHAVSGAVTCGCEALDCGCRYAMVCDLPTLTLRFAFPQEKPLGYLSLAYLGTHCNPYPKGDDRPRGTSGR